MSGRATLRSIARLIAMAGLLVACAILFYLWQPFARPNPWPRRFLAGIARIAGVRIRTMGAPAAGRLLMLANHVSWIDIPALAATTGTAFVAHDGLAAVPLLRRLCEMNDTIFIARHDRASIGAQIDALRVALVDKRTVTVFPEGTTSDGTVLLPFKSALLAALDPLAPGIGVRPIWAVQPVRLDYGPQTAAIAWVDDEPGMANFRRILARAGSVELTIHFLAPLTGPAIANRKTMAIAAQAAIMHAKTPLQISGVLP